MPNRRMKTHIKRPFGSSDSAFRSRTPEDPTRIVETTCNTCLGLNDYWQSDWDEELENRAGHRYDA